MVVADVYPNYSICGLPFYLSGETPDWRSLAHRSTSALGAAGVGLLLEHQARSIDPARRSVLVRASTGRERELRYDQLVVATGATAKRAAMEGLGIPGVGVLHTMADAFTLHPLVSANASNRAVIVGAGYIGVEMADALTHRGLSVTLLGSAPSVLPTLEPDLGELLAAELRRGGVEVVTGARVDGIIEGGDGRPQVIGEDGRSWVADVVVVATGVEPDTTLATSAGIALGAHGAIAVDRRMATSASGVWAAGDCAETFHGVTAAPTYLPLGTTAHKQGRVAGENAAGGNRAFAGSIGTQVVKVFGLAAARTGLLTDEARAAGFEPRSDGGVYDDHKAYYPGATPLHVRLTGDAHSGRLLGAQVVGAAGAQVAKRIDTCATLIAEGARVDRLIDLDLSYTPPFSSPWDPLQQAAMAWERTGPLVARSALDSDELSSFD